jgi:hypothetical protein
MTFLLFRERYFAELFWLILWRNLTRVLFILYLSASRQTCVSAGSNPGRLRCRRALKQRAIRTACIFAVRNHYFCGDYYPLIVSGIFSRHNTVLIQYKNWHNCHATLMVQNNIGNPIRFFFLPLSGLRKEDHSAALGGAVVER